MTATEQECHEEVTRKGEAQPCDKTAVAYRKDPVFGGSYPVCRFHTRGTMVSLSEVEAAARAKVEVTEDMVTKAWRAHYIAVWGDDLDPEDIGAPSDRADMRAALSAALGGGE